MARSTSPSDFLIRKATQPDAAGILLCLSEAFEPYRSRYSLSAFADTVLTSDTLEQRLRSMSVFVATTPAGEIIGTIGCNLVSAGEGHLRGMAVRHAWQGSGVAAELLSAAERELRAMKCSLLTLDTTEPLTRAMHFYEKNGYRRSGKVVDFFGMVLIELVKTLTE